MTGPARAAAPKLDGWRDLDRMLSGMGLRVGAPTAGQTSGGSHAKGSAHYTGRGRDYGRTSDAAGIARALVPLATGPFRQIDELFFSPAGIFYDNGQAFTPSAKLRADHQNHAHVAIRAGATPPPPGQTLDEAIAAHGGPKVAAGQAGGIDVDLGDLTPDWLDSLGAIAGNLTDPAWWRRVGIFAAGGALVAVGAGLVLKDTLIGAAASAVTGGATDALKGASE